MRKIVLLLVAGGLIFQSPAMARPDFRAQRAAAPHMQGRPQVQARPETSSPANRFRSAPQQQPPPQRFAPPAYARQSAPPQEQRPEISPGDAAHRAQEANGGGRVLAVDPSQQGYRVKLLKDGEVRAVQIPPNPH